MFIISYFKLGGQPTGKPTTIHPALLRLRLELKWTWTASLWKDTNSRHLRDDFHAYSLPCKWHAASCVGKDRKSRGVQTRTLILDIGYKEASQKWIAAWLMGGAVRKHHSNDPTADPSVKTTEKLFSKAERSVWNTVIGHGAQTMSKESSISVLIRHMVLRALAFLLMTVWRWRY